MKTSRAYGRARAVTWIVCFAYGALLGGAGTLWLLLGRPFDASTYAALEAPFLRNAAAALMFRTTAGDSALLAGVLIMAISATAFRLGEVWAWLVMWVLPMHARMDLALVLGHGGDARGALVWDLGAAGTVALALILGRKPSERESKASALPR